MQNLTQLKILLGSCKSLITNYGYNYKTYYEISELSEHSPNHVLDLNFKVQASSNAHILLSPSTDISTDDPVYEIVLGAGANTFSDIRRMRRTKSKTKHPTKDLLSVNHMKPFWLRVSTGIVTFFLVKSSNK